MRDHGVEGAGVRFFKSLAADGSAAIVELGETR